VITFAECGCWHRRAYKQAVDSIPISTPTERQSIFRIAFGGLKLIAVDQMVLSRL
jgi:hypothetical protein